MVTHTTVITVDALLLDMDGTLIDSTLAVEGAWARFAEKYSGLDIQKILQTAHGVRTVDNLRNFCGITDPDELEAEATRFEVCIVEEAAKGSAQGMVILPGAKEIIDVIAPFRHQPSACWAICTSATNAYASRALGLVGIPIPDVFVTSESVKQGKPFPDPYLRGAELLGVDPAKCLVFEDAPSGVRSGKAAGCTTIGLLTTHTEKELKDAQADYIIQDLSKMSVRKTEKGIEVTIHHRR